MPTDHNYMAFPRNEHSLAQVLSFLSGVTLSDFETLGSDYDDSDNNGITSVSTISVQPSEEAPNYACDQCGLHVRGNSEELRKHYFHIALKIYFCRNCGCVYKNEECLNEHIDQVHVRKNCSLGGAGQQTFKRVIPVLFMVKELINTDYKGAESTTDDLETAGQQPETDMPTKIPFDNEYAFKDSPIETKKPSPNPSQKPKHQPKLTREKLSITRFPCLKCGKAFSTIDLLRRHNKRVHMKVYECEECEDRPTFRTLGEHLNHTRTVHKAQKEKLYAKSRVCETCGEQFKTPNALWCHKTVYASPNADFTCNQCGEMFCSCRHLKAHETTHTLGRSFICHICGKSFKQKNYLDTHINRHYNASNLSCDVCGKHFNAKSNLTRHRMIHTGEMPFMCHICGKKFRQKFGLKTHMLQHNVEDVDEYTCNVCGKISQLKYIHEKHMLLHSRGKNRRRKIPRRDRYRCDQCGKCLANNTFLRLHMAVHSDERNYKCDECDKMFKTDHALNLHKKVHLAKISRIRYDCKICLKRFQAVRYVKTHLKYFHSEALRDNPRGNGLYEVVSDEPQSLPNEQSSSNYNSVCEQGSALEYLQGFYMRIAETAMKDVQQAHQKDMIFHSKKGENFKSKGNNENLELNNGEKEVKCQDSKIASEDRYKCDQCGKRLANNTFLRLHKAVHSNERNYKCDECDKMFKTDHALSLHKKTHLAKVSSIRYDCKMCNKRFQALRYVKTHLKYFHSEALKDNPKGDGLYEVVSDEQQSLQNEPSSSKDSSVCEVVSDEQQSLQNEPSTSKDSSVCEVVSDEQQSLQNEPSSSKDNSLCENKNKFLWEYLNFVGTPETIIDEQQTFNVSAL